MVPFVLLGLAVAGSGDGRPTAAQVCTVGTVCKCHFQVNGEGCCPYDDAVCCPNGMTSVSRSLPPHPPPVPPLLLV